jgi:hypothetical protein
MDAAKGYCEKKISFLKANHDKLVEVTTDSKDIFRI